MNTPSSLTELKEEIYKETERIMEVANKPPSREEALLDVALRTCDRISPERLHEMLQGDTAEYWS